MKKKDMSLKDRINEDIKAAMKAKEQDKLAALRAVKSAILLAETEKGAGEGINNDQEVALLQRLVKQRKEAAELYVQQGREDLAKEEFFQAEVVSVYLPQQLSEEEVRKELADVIEKTGASSMADMGKVMGMAMGKLKGKADGKLISSLVKELLA